MKLKKKIQSYSVLYQAKIKTGVKLKHLPAVVVSVFFLFSLVVPLRLILPKACFHSRTHPAVWRCSDGHIWPGCRSPPCSLPALPHFWSRSLWLQPERLSLCFWPRKTRETINSTCMSRDGAFHGPSHLISLVLISNFLRWPPSKLRVYLFLLKRIQKNTSNIDNANLGDRMVWANTTSSLHNLGNGLTIKPHCKTRS